MSNRFRFELDRDGVRELLRSPEALAVCQEYADNAARKLGDGYEVTTLVGKNRVNAQISAETPEAKRDNIENNTLLKALFND